jgi:Lrp/AsnC family transcriptional regulator for asnA, asnC and gidA
LIEKNILKIVGLLNLSERPELIGAIVGINANAQGHLDALTQKDRGPALCHFGEHRDRPFRPDRGGPGGRRRPGPLPLYQRTASRVAGPGVISRSETFVVMKSRNKWITLPRGCWEQGADAAALSRAPPQPAAA